MTFAPIIRFAAPLLLAATLAGCVVPYDDTLYYSRPYYSGNSYGGSSYSGSYYGGRYHGGDVYAVHPSRSDRAHRRDRRDGDGDFRRRQGVHERSGLEERHRRDRAEGLREGRRAAADRAERAARRDRRVGRQIAHDRAERAAERPAAERRARLAERQTQERDRVPRRYHDYRDPGETDAAFARRVERAGRQAERESMTMEQILANGAVPEK